MISPKIKLLRGDTNTLKFANINRVYFRVGQPEYISLTQKNSNEFRIGLALHETNVDDIRPLLVKEALESVFSPESNGLLGSYKDLPRKNVFSCFLQSIEF